MERPPTITECNCSLCRRYGARWAYYTRRTARIVAPADSLVDYAPGQDLYFDHCRTCGCIVFYGPIIPKGDTDRLAINMRLLDDPDSIAGIEVRRFDGARSWETVGTCILEQPWW